MNRLGIASLLLLTVGCPGPDPVLPDAMVTDAFLNQDSLSCLPNNDGVIEQGELTFLAGLGAVFVVNPPGTLAKLNPAGRWVEGQTEWDFSDNSGVAVKMTVEPVSGWYAQHFPGADIAMGVTAKADMLQILKIEQGRVLLMGLVSRQPEQTLMIYDPPIEAMRFPLRRGLTFTSTARLKEGSKVNGLPFYSEDTYTVSINRQGTLRLPHLRLHKVLLIETLVTIRAVGGIVKTTRQLQWFAECYGEAVRALSAADEPKALFTQAVELRRISL